MFTNGQKVVCINDSFGDWVYGLYDELPIKGHTYTIRTTSMGRTDPKDIGHDSMEESVTLKEIKNGADPHYKGGTKELEFQASRFRELEEVFEKEVKNQYATV